MLYCLMYSRDMKYDGAITPCIYSAKRLFIKGNDCRLIIGKDPITNYFQYEDEFIEKLTALIAEILNPAIPFTQTTLTKKCEYFTYNKICLTI